MKYTPKEIEVMRDYVRKEWDDVLTFAPHRGKGIVVTGALKIGEPTKLHADLTRAKYRGVGKRTIYNNGEQCYRRYHEVTECTEVSQ